MNEGKGSRTLVGSRRRIRYPVALVAACVTGVLALAGSVSAPASASVGNAAPPGADNLTLTATPSALQILAVPCGARTVDVAVRNDSSQATYADILLYPDAPLSASPDVISSYLPAGYTLHTPVLVSAPLGSSDADAQITVKAGRTGRGSQISVPVVVKAAPSGPGANLAISSTVSASSTHANFRACGAIDGNSNSADWQTATGWNDGSSRVFPDWLAVTFAQTHQVSRVDMYTLNSTRYPATRYGLRDWDVQVWDAGANGGSGDWRTVASVRGNATGLVSSTFDPVSTTAVRVLVIASNDATYSRIVELEVYQ
ncbi:galactose-binding domain-containing protein [Actinopolymorpha singaporensis]